MQSNLASWIEAILNTASGFLISLLFWSYVIVPVWHIQVTHKENVVITSLFTIISVIRSYIWRRIFNKQKVEQLVESARVKAMQGTKSHLWKAIKIFS